MAREPIANATAEHKYEVDKRWQDGSNTMCDNIVFPLDTPASNRSVWDVTATSYQPNALAYTRAQPHQPYTAAPLTRTTSAKAPFASCNWDAGIAHGQWSIANTRQKMRKLEPSSPRNAMLTPIVLKH